MKNRLLTLAFALFLAALGYRHQLEIGLFFEHFINKNNAHNYAASVHFAAVPASFDGLFVEETPIFQRKTENLILVTLDGLRWQELFGGADSVLINDPEYSDDTASLRRLFWAETPDDRRRKLLPFFWEKLTPEGLVLGNRWLGSRCEVANAHWFSYPGYAEMLCGQVDNRINSNRKVDNPHPTVFEFLNQKKRFHDRTAVFASWDVFPSIYNEKRSGIPINAAIETPDGHLNCREQLLDELQKQNPSPWDGVRDDLYTFHIGFEFLKKNKPRLLALHFDGTDDSAHDGNYDAYLKYANQTDQFLKILWNYLQKEPFYRQKTTLLITCDHGRGGAKDGDWKHHGRSTDGSDQIWMAVIGPDTPKKGEAAGPHPVVFQKQVAPTIAALLGYEFLADDPAPGLPVRSCFLDENF